MPHTTNYNAKIEILSVLISLIINSYVTDCRVNNYTLVTNQNQIQATVKAV